MFLIDLKFQIRKVVVCLLCLIVLCSQFFLGGETYGGTEPDIVITLAMGNSGTAAIDLDILDSYGKLPEPLRQFFITTRSIFDQNRYAGYANNSALADAIEDYGINVLGGPMLGDVGPNGVSVWMRTIEPAEVSVEVKDTENNVTTYGPVSSTTGQELAAVVRLDGLEPDSEYSYRVFVDGLEVRTDYPKHFTTLKAGVDDVTCRIAFGADFHKAGVQNPYLLGQITARGNRAAFLYGDLAVGDRNNKVGLHRSDYLLRDLSLAWQKFAATVPVYATWDDHDYFGDNKAGIPSGYTAADVAAVRKVWMQNWNNPTYGKDNEGIYFHTKIGPADVIMLDNRSLRYEDPNIFLGDKQTQWLQQELLKCTGPFTIISCGSMWTDNIAPGVKDSWGHWDPAARERLFQFIEDHNIPGVLMLSGDRHGARGFKVPRPSGYTFYEFEIGSLGGMGGSGGNGADAWVDGPAPQFFGYGQDLLKAFGEFTFDTSPADPTVTFRLVKENGDILEEWVFTRSQLTPGIQNDSDINKDGKVNNKDLKIIFDDWLIDYGHTIQLDALMGRWDFSEGSGNFASDVSGNGHHGTLYGNAAIVNDAERGKVLKVNGSSSDYVEITGYKGILGGDSRTACAWINTSQNSGRQIFLSWGKDSAGQKYVFTVRDTVLRTAIFTGEIRGTANITDGQWHHVATVFDNGLGGNINTSKLYVDGVLDTISTSTSYTVNTVSDKDVRIGNFVTDTGRCYNGLIDDVRIYSKALSDEDIMDIYTGAESGGGEMICLLEPESDLNGDCKVNFIDFAILADHWLK